MALGCGGSGRVAKVASEPGAATPDAPPSEPSFAARAPARTRLLSRFVVRDTELAAQLGALQALVPECGLDLKRELDEVAVSISEPQELRIELTGTLSVAAGQCVVQALEQRGALGPLALGVTQSKHGIRIATAGAKADGPGGAPALTRRFDELTARSKFVLVADVAPGGGSYEAWGVEDHEVEARVALGSPEAAARAAKWAAEVFGASAELRELEARADGAALALRLPRPERMPALALKRELLEAFRTPSESMAPALIAGDHVFVAKGPSARRVSPGEIVAFESPRDPAQVLLKRVIGVAGDRVQIDGRAVRVNGVALQTALGEESLGDHRYRVLHDPGLDARDRVDVTVASNSLFLLGDNRDNSFDSRQFGAVSLESVKGRAVLIWASFAESRPRWERFGTYPD